MTGRDCGEPVGNVVTFSVRPVDRLLMTRPSLQLVDKSPGVTSMTFGRRRVFASSSRVTTLRGNGTSGLIIG